MNTYKRKQKLKKLSHWINDVFRNGLSRNQKNTWNQYNNEINNTRHMSRDMYRDFKLKVLSLAVIAEYCDYEDMTGERKTKIYTCYQNNGNVPNDLLVLIEYVLRFFRSVNENVNEIQQIRDTIIFENERIMTYKKYFELKNTIIRKVSSGFKNSVYHKDDLYTVIAQ